MHVTVFRWFGKKGKIEIDYVIHESKKSSDWDGNQDEAYKAAFASKEQHQGVDGFGDELKLLLTNVLVLSCPPARSLSKKPVRHQRNR